MTKKNSLLNLFQERNAKREPARDCKQGITERLLKKYRPSKVLGLIDGKMKHTKNDIAA